MKKIIAIAAAAVMSMSASAFADGWYGTDNTIYVSDTYIDGDLSVHVYSDGSGPGYINNSVGIYNSYIGGSVYIYQITGQPFMRSDVAAGGDDFRGFIPKVF